VQNEKNWNCSDSAEEIGACRRRQVNRREFIRSAVVAGATGLSGEGQSSPQEEKNQSLTILPKAVKPKLRIYSHILDPREHPDYTRRHVQPPSWETFGGKVHFAAIREFNIVDGKIVGYLEEIEKYSHQYDLGDVLWIRYPILFAENLGEFVDDLRRLDLFLFDIWGYVPGSGPGGPWQQFQAPEGTFGLLESKLGDYWLGMDNGEQDGRYVGSYAVEFYPSSKDRFQQYLNFHRHFEGLTNQLGSKMAALVSMNFGHYFLKEGLYTLIGAETGQGLPNAQVYYSFLRGAGKQYGVLWFGNASVYNRWGWKHYGQVGSDRESGPTKGTSLSLMKRLMYSHLLYNSVLVGFESGFLTCEDDTEAAGECNSAALSPIGLIQRAAQKWLREVGNPGPMVTQFALMVDFFAGWGFPRRDPAWPVYRAWGNVPFGAGDYLTEGLFDMFYPGYQDSSFFEDERGFLTSTPYGDGADCLLSDAPGWLLARYPLLVIAGELHVGAELRDKLETYVQTGGHLLLTAGNLAKFNQGLFEIRALERLTYFPAQTRVSVGAVTLVEETTFDLCALSFPHTAHILAESCGVAAAIELSVGKGRVTVFASSFGVAAQQAKGSLEDFRSDLNKPLAKPYPLLKSVRMILRETFRSQMLFEAGEGLSLITCRNAVGEYMLGISNPSWHSQHFTIVSHCGLILAIEEMPLDQSEKESVGYLPEKLAQVDLGSSDDQNIAGGDMRVFLVRVSEQRIDEIIHIVPPARPLGRVLPLREALSIQEEVLARPSFFEHFDSIMIDWRYLRQRDKAQLERESRWIDRQKLGVLVDLTSGINLFPDLRLVSNSPYYYASSLEAIEDLIAKMKILSAKNLIVALHKFPENNFTDEQTWNSFEETLRRVCQKANQEEIRVHLRLRLSTPPHDLSAAITLLDRVQIPNLLLAPSIAFLTAGEPGLRDAATLLKGKVGLWLISQSETDVAGYIWNENAPVRGYLNPQNLAKLLQSVPEALVVFDAVYKNKDEEYLDSMFLRSLLTKAQS
jgi:hypothetical protein